MTAEDGTLSPQIDKAQAPDAWSLTVRKDKTEHLIQTRVKTTELYFPTEPGTYTYELTAHWDLSVERDWYGDLNYVLEIHIAEPQPTPQLPETPEGETLDP